MITLTETAAAARRPAQHPELEIVVAEGGNSPLSATVFQPESQQYVRLGAAAHRLLMLCDGSRSVGEIAEAIGRRADDADVAAALVQLERSGLLLGEDGRAATPETAHRRRTWGPFEVTVVSWAQVRVVVMRPERFFTRLQPVLRRALSPRPLAALAGLLVATAWFVTAHRRLLAPAVPTGLFSREMVLASLLFWPFIGAHEFAHAAVLSRFGGRVRGIGAMLFYLRPAFFVDANDAWLLPRRWHRAAVASAGIVFHLVSTVVLLGIVTASQMVDSDPALWERVLLQLALVNLLMAVLNCCPFIKLDGYWMLSAAIDRPNLRAESLREARRALVGSAAPRTRRLRVPLAVFGVLSALTGGALLVVAYIGIHAWLLGLGTLGLVVLRLLQAALLWTAFRRMPRWVRAVRDAMAETSPARRWGLATAACALAVGGYALL